MLKLHTIVRATDDYVKQMGWKNINVFCRDTGLGKYDISYMLWPGEPISIDCSLEIQNELLISRKKIKVHFIVHGRVYYEEVISYKLGNCRVITDKEFEKLF